MSLCLVKLRQNCICVVVILVAYSSFCLSTSIDAKYLKFRTWNPRLFKDFWSHNVLVDLFEFLSIEFIACSKLPSRDIHLKAGLFKVLRILTALVKILCCRNCCGMQLTSKEVYNDIKLNWKSFCSSVFY